MLESLEERYQKQARQGGVGESGGCTDASVRLSTLLKVLCETPCMSAQRRMPSSQQHLRWTALGVVSIALRTCAPVLCTPWALSGSFQWCWICHNHNQHAYADLAFCWQALGHAPAGVVKGRAQDWVPLCLSLLSAKGNPAQWDAAEPQPAEADAQAGGAQQAESPSEAAVAEAAGGQGQVLRIGARCAAPPAVCAQGPLRCLAPLRTLHVFLLHVRHSPRLYAHMCLWSDNLESVTMAGKARTNSRHNACLCS